MSSELWKCWLSISLLISTMSASSLFDAGSLEPDWSEAIYPMVKFSSPSPTPVCLPFGSAAWDFNSFILITKSSFRSERQMSSAKAFIAPPEFVLIVCMTYRKSELIISEKPSFSRPSMNNTPISLLKSLNVNPFMLFLAIRCHFFWNFICFSALSM